MQQAYCYLHKGSPFIVSIIQEVPNAAALVQVTICLRPKCVSMASFRPLPWLAPTSVSKCRLQAISPLGLQQSHAVTFWCLVHKTIACQVRPPSAYYPCGIGSKSQWTFEVDRASCEDDSAHSRPFFTPARCLYQLKMPFLRYKPPTVCLFV